MPRVGRFRARDQGILCWSCSWCCNVPH